MNVQELIDKLNELPDKDNEIKVYVDGRLSGFLEVKEVWSPSSEERYYIRTKNAWLYTEDLPR